MTDQILLTGVRGTGHHGGFAHERHNGQEFIVDVILDVETANAAASDDLANTVDYGAVANAVHARIVGDPFHLIETLAEAIAGDCRVFPAVSRVVVTVHKPNAPIEVPFADVAVRITRSRAHVE